MNTKQTIVLTGASGFIGKYFIQNFINNYTIFAIARRSRNETGIPFHDNLHWIQCDISNLESVISAGDYIKSIGGVDYLVHLAAYYDYSYKDNDAYDRINVDGTKNVLELAKTLGVKRFIFASSLAACNFPKSNSFITEETSPDATFHYARSKKLGEMLCKGYSHEISCTIVRFAAVFSDWCEYAPLNMFLNTWLARRIESKFLAGKGESAVTYIHIRDLLSFLSKILENSQNLPKYNVLLASPDTPVTHKEIFEISNRYFYGHTVKPYFLPKFLALPGLYIKKLLNLFRPNTYEVFERPWMLKYIDKKLNVNSQKSRDILQWEPTPRLNLKRRLIFLLENMKNHPDEWNIRNSETLKRTEKRVNLLIYEKMVECKEDVLQNTLNLIYKSNDILHFKKFKEYSHSDNYCNLSALYHLLLATIRSTDKSLFLDYIDKIVIRRFAEGYEPVNLIEMLKVFQSEIIKQLNNYAELKEYKQNLYDNISFPFQLAEDEIEDLYDNLVLKIPEELYVRNANLPDCPELQKTIKQLSALYQVSPEEYMKR